MQSFIDTYKVFRYSPEEALNVLFQPDTLASAECLKTYERKPSLEPEKKLMFAVLKDAWLLPKLFPCNGQAAKMVSGSGGMVQSEGGGFIFSFSKAAIVECVLLLNCGKS